MVEHHWSYVVDGETVWEYYPNHDNFNSAYMDARDELQKADVPENGELRYTGSDARKNV